MNDYVVMCNGESVKVKMTSRIAALKKARKMLKVSEEEWINSQKEVFQETDAPSGNGKGDAAIFIGNTPTFFIDAPDSSSLALNMIEVILSSLLNNSNDEEGGKQ